MLRKLTTKDFIERARAAHGDKYDYSKSQYTKARTKTTVTCPYHGDFLVAPEHHWRGTGCTACSGKRQLTTAEFIKRSAKAHGDRYDYTNSVYVSDGVKVNIVCREHGQFSQLPRSHYGGAGCPKCARCARVPFSDFVKRSRVVHKDRYIYPPQRLLRTHQKVIIICRDHGEFSQVAKDHMSGHGCRACAGLAPLDTEEFVARSKGVHGGKYSYERSVYIRSQGKVTITCPDHGDFEQIAYSHLAGHGCGKCLWDRDQPTCVYLLKMGRLVKVGVSIDPEARLAALNKTNPSPATLLNTWLLPDFPAAQKIEFAAHAALAYRHAGLAGFDGATEWFHVSPSYAANIIDRLIDGDPCQLSFKLLAA